MDHKKTLLRYLMRGYCCSEALVRMGLELLEEEEDEILINAAAGLCNGMHSGGVCGGLTGGCMLLAMADRALAPRLCQELYEWFEATFAARYGSMACAAIRGEDLLNKLERCQPLILAVGEKCAELLQDHGVIEEGGDL